MTPFTLATALLVAGGIAGVGWILWPVLRPADEPEPEDEAPVDEHTDVNARLDVVLESGSADDDEAVAWTQRQSMLPDEPRRVPWDLVPAEILPILHHDDGVVLVPIASALLALDVPDAPPSFAGRRQGRAFHAIRVADGIYLDLIEALRLLPVIAVELEARGIEARDIVLVDDLGGIDAPEDGLSAVASWLVGTPAPRVLPEDAGAREATFTVAGHALALNAWMPAVADGIRTDALGWAGVLTFDGGVESGATSPETLASLGVEPAVRTTSLEAWRWSRIELTELAAVGHYLEEQGIEVLRLLQDAFADHTYPMPDLHDEAQSLTAAAVLNWVAVVHRRAGYPKRAIGLLDAALTTCAPGDDDNRADIHYNRGYCRLQALMSVAPEPTGTADLHVAAFESPPSADDLEPARQDFELAARLNPNDAHAWSQIALIHQLLGASTEAQDAWLQAATRTHDPDAQRQLLANADALR